MSCYRFFKWGLEMKLEETLKTRPKYAGILANPKNQATKKFFKNP